MRRLRRLISVVVLLAPSLLWAAAPCTHYAARNGTGTACTQTQPCKVSSWWPLAGPGKTLCLQDGTYTGAAAMLAPPATVRGTASQPVTIRAEHDGLVLLDAQHQGWAIRLDSNEYVHIEGMNARNGLESLISVGGKHNRVRRTIGWNGTSGEQNSFIWYVWGVGSVAEDCAGWGMNSRKIFNGSQAGDMGGGGFRRCWGEFNDHTQGTSDPNNTFQAGYGSINQLWENMLGTWVTLGQTANTEGVFTIFRGGGPGPGNSMEQTRVLGSVFYVTPGTTYTPFTLLLGLDLSNAVLRDVAMVVPPGAGSKRPFLFQACPSEPGGLPCSGNVCENCLAVHDGGPGINEAHSGWTLPGLHQGKGLAAATGGESPFTLLPGLCQRYVGGQLTDQPLWPWPMDQRIKEARLASGRPAMEVTTTIEAMLGPIPAACRAGSGSVISPPPPTRLRIENFGRGQP